MTSTTPAGPGAVRPPSRPLRAAVAAGVATASGAAGHVLVGGAISLPVLVAALAVAVVPAWLLTTRERSWAAIAGLQVGTQQLVHGVLSVAGPAEIGAGLVPHDLMFAGHVLAGLLTAAVMRVGERRLWLVARRLARRVACRWRRLLAGPAWPRADVVRVPTVTQPWADGRRLLRHVLVLRGPPLSI